jgi:hypothetical protein
MKATLTRYNLSPYVRVSCATYLRIDPRVTLNLNFLPSHGNAIGSITFWAALLMSVAYASTQFYNKQQCLIILAGNFQPGIEIMNFQ